MTNRETRVRARRKFGAALRAGRERLEMTQTDLAVRLGIAQTQVSNYENGLHEPPPATTFELERLLKLKSGELSRHLGYTPTAQRAGGQQQKTVAAILEDETLGEREREALVSLYKTLSNPNANNPAQRRRGKISA